MIGYDLMIYYIFMLSDCQKKFFLKRVSLKRRFKKRYVCGIITFVIDVNVCLNTMDTRLKSNNSVNNYPITLLCTHNAVSSIDVESNIIQLIYLISPLRTALHLNTLCPWSS